MKYVVLISHGEFAPGLRTAVFMMTGEREEVLCTNLKSDMSADTFQENFRELVKPITEDDEVILMCDILGGSPMSKAVEVLAERNLLDKSIVLTGMNMPMAMTAVIMKDNIDDRNTLKEIILNEARNAVTEFVVETPAEDSDDDIDKIVNLINL